MDGRWKDVAPQPRQLCHARNRLSVPSTGPFPIRHPQLCHLTPCFGFSLRPSAHRRRQPQRFVFARHRQNASCCFPFHIPNRRWLIMCHGHDDGHASPRLRIPSLYTRSASRCRITGHAARLAGAEPTPRNPRPATDVCRAWARCTPRIGKSTDGVLGAMYPHHSCFTSPLNNSRGKWRASYIYDYYQNRMSGLRSPSSKHWQPVLRLRV